MSIVNEFHYPSRWYTKLLIVILAFTFFALLATVVISGVLTYWIVSHSGPVLKSIWRVFRGVPTRWNSVSPGLATGAVGFFPGFRGAPTIVLLHGYESSRGNC